MPLIQASHPADYYARVGHYTIFVQVAVAALRQTALHRRICFRHLRLSGVDLIHHSMAQLAVSYLRAAGPRSDFSGSCPLWAVSHGAESIFYLTFEKHKGGTRTTM